MWTYMKMLQYPVNIKTTNAKLATAIITQLGGRNCNTSKDAFIRNNRGKKTSHPWFYRILSSCIYF